MEQLCDQLCYRLELAYFIAGFNLGEERQGATKRIFIRGNQAIREENIQGPADPFVANLVLELLAMHSPVRVSMRWLGLYAGKYPQAFDYTDFPYI